VEELGILCLEQPEETIIKVRFGKKLGDNIFAAGG
jgi:hypothetical protein